ncbi:hypothetical protein J2T60_000900 [Natronospira proteinivora]|uniref:DUF3047 family protein n=1 Tax=Natronospira proteinivora TaxID=1807133 RepID=A0ABT1G6M3_9GAMM|nr:DUF3047 domain-containing protein [Natronospira proteinivora]MCP1726935.1 hypothetical protein [Natronospira proteinivora]
MPKTPYLPWFFALLGLCPIAQAETTTEGLTFSPEDIIQWQVERFDGETEYRLVEVDGRQAIHARCDNAASALYLEQTIDLNETPVLEWEWRVASTFGEDIDETVKEGDDYPARVYAVMDGGWRRWRTRAVNYVWASQQAAGEHWPNAYTDSVVMLALRSGDDQAGNWQQERRNLKEDFKRFHDLEISTIDGLAIMSDCDDQETTIEAWYGSLRLLPE